MGHTGSTVRSGARLARLTDSRQKLMFLALQCIRWPLLLMVLQLAVNILDSCGLAVFAAKVRLQASSLELRAWS